MSEIYRGDIESDELKCEYCGKLTTYEEWYNEMKTRLKNRFRPKMMPVFWKRKRVCNKECGYKFRTTMTKKCVHCGETFSRPIDQSMTGWKRRKMCSTDCALEYGFITKLAPRLGMTYEQLKKELLTIAKKYNK